MKLVTLSAVAMMFAALALPLEAAAQPATLVEPPPSWISEAQQSRVGVEFDWQHPWEQTFGAHTLTWDLAAQIRVARHVFLDANVAWAYVNPRDYISPPKALFGVPSLGAHFAATVHRNVAVFAGIGFGVPVLGAPSSEAEFMQGEAARARGYQDRYRYSPWHFPILLRGGVEIDLPPFFAQVDLAPVFLIGFRGCGTFPGLSSVQRCDDRETAVYLDQGTNVGLRARFGLFGGVRLQESFLLTDAPDRVQVAVEPFLGYTSPSRVGVFARYGFLVTLDADASATTQHRFTHRFTIGAKF